MKTIREIMRPSFLFLVHKTSSVSEAVHAMAEHNVGIVAVVDGDSLVGVFSERDVVRRVVDRGLDAAQTTVEQVMTTDLVLGDVNEDCQVAMMKMDRANIRHLPVVSGGKIVSMLSIRDLMRAEIDNTGVEIEHLRAYLFQVPPVVAAGRPFR
ncbi:MAG: CBS domain-containing protein [Vicinamibacterales bacterium]